MPYFSFIAIHNMYKPLISLNVGYLEAFGPEKTKK